MYVQTARANGGQNLYYLMWLKGCPMSKACALGSLSWAHHVILMPLLTKAVTRGLRCESVVSAHVQVHGQHT